MRRSSWGALAADVLSKNNSKEFGEVMIGQVGKVKQDRAVSRAFLQWLENPVVDRDLGKRIVQELNAKGRIRSYF